MTTVQRTALVALVALTALAVLFGRARRSVERGDPWSAPLVDRDLGVIANDTLRVLAVSHPLTYEAFPGGERGMELELLERFARHAKLRLSVRVVAPDSLLPMLQRGAGDVVAALLDTGRFGGSVAHTQPWWHVSPVRVRLRPDIVASVPDHVPDTLLVPARGPWALDTASFLAGVGAHILDARDGAELVAAVALGRTPSALVTDLELRHLAQDLPQLEWDRLDTVRTGLVMAVRRNAPRLRAALDAWFALAEEQEARALIVSAYGPEPIYRGPLVGWRVRPVDGDSLSPFDALFREKAGLMRWDWELLAAIAFKESRFDTSARSVRGAQGLMQMMPSTARKLGMDSLHLVEEQVHAAAVYLALLDSLWRPTVQDVDERLRFVLASYNAGPGHVRDAQVIARSFGLDPLHWTGHVERAITLLALPSYYGRSGVGAGRCQGAQTFYYVREVLALYERYRGAARSGGGP